MRTRILSRLVLVVLAAATLAPPALHAQRRTQTATLAPLPQATPESVGFAPGALGKMDEGMQGLIDQKHLAGIVTLVARKGKVVQHKAYGMQDAEKQTPMRTDTIARIYSMTKPITGVAMMMLYEEGKWRPSDPIVKHIPAFANLKVFAGEKDGQMILEDPAHPPTMGELMSHTAGFTYGLFGNTPVDKLYRAANPLTAPSLPAFIDAVALVEVPTLLEERAVVQRARVRNHDAGEERRARRGPRPAERLGHHAAVRHEVQPPVHHARAAGGGGLEQAVQRALVMEAVVAAQKADPVAVRKAQRLVPGLVQAAVRLGHEARDLARARVRLHQLARAVRGGAVDDDHLARGGALCRDAVQASLQRARAVLHADDHAHRGKGAGRAPGKGFHAWRMVSTARRAAGRRKGCVQSVNLKYSR